jgi:hypothetical protein
MKKHLLYLLLFLVGLSFAAVRTSADTLSIAPVGPVAQGSTFTVDVNVDIAASTDLYAFQFDLAFNPSILRSTGVITEAPFFNSGGGLTPGTVDNTAGTIAGNADVIVGPGPGVTGSGTLLEFQFLALASGASFLDLSNALFYDSNLDEKTVDLSNGSVDVTSTVATPEPSALLLFASALISLVLLAILKWV